MQIPTPPTAQPLYPTMNNLAEVEAYALSCVPVLTANTMLSILKLQQNTIINILKKNN